MRKPEYAKSLRITNGVAGALAPCPSAPRAIPDPDPDPVFRHFLTRIEGEVAGGQPAHPPPAGCPSAAPRLWAGRLSMRTSAEKGRFLRADRRAASNLPLAAAYQDTKATACGLLELRGVRSSLIAPAVPPRPCCLWPRPINLRSLARRAECSRLTHPSVAHHPARELSRHCRRRHHRHGFRAGRRCSGRGPRLGERD